MDPDIERDFGGNGIVDYPVLIIDDHELFSTSLMMALSERGIDAHQLPVARVDEFLRAPASKSVGLVVLDIDLGRDARDRPLNGADLVAGLRKAGWQVLVVSGSADEPMIAAAIAAGAVGSVPKSSAFDLLLRTVLAAAGGEPVMSEEEHRRWMDRHRGFLARDRELTRKLDRLSAREREVLELLVEGKRAAAIAEHFVVEMTTVRSQIRSILAKLEVGGQLEAVALIRERSPRGRSPG